MTMCFSAISTQAFGTDTELWINDAINNVTWPNPPADFNPEVSGQDMYDAPNGFTKKFSQADTEWCINGGFDKMLTEYSGKDVFTFKAAVALKDFSKCEPDPAKAIVA